jgi:16S rRNA processing protein RimM
MVDPFQEYADIGYVQRPHGTQGEVILDLKFKLNKLDYFVVDLEGSRVPFKVEECSLVDKKAYVKLVGIKTLSDVEFIKGKRVLVEGSYIPEEEALLQGIVGYEAIDTIEGFIGKVIGISEMPLQRMIHLERAEEEKELLVPYHSDIIKAIDHANKKILTRLPQDFL